MTAEDAKTEALQLFRQGRYEQALAAFETAVGAYAAEKDDAGRGEMLNNIGVVRRLLGQPEAARAALTEAETLFAGLGDKVRQGQALGNLADVHAQTKDRTAAARAYSSAAQLFAEAGDGEKQAQVLRALSLLRLRQGQFVTAMMHMEQSLSARPRVGVGGWLFRALLRFALRLFGGG